MEKELITRSGNECELCGASSQMSAYLVSPKSGTDLNELVHICGACQEQLDGTSELNPNHWRCLSESMWSEIPAVKVIAWRMLNQLKAEEWAIDLLHMMYLDEEMLNWAEFVSKGEEKVIKHIDCNGAELVAGDAVVLIKDLNVKGANFTAKRGTSVRNITLVHDNAEHIEGKVNGQKIVILTQYVKK
ncbi:MAG: PhnA domain-containing protein [Flavobacteriales bacterium]|nr:PhnA domain-containing protein [Flavobacteriales bacterium]